MRIEQLRVQARWSIEDLVRASGLSRPTVSKVEREGLASVRNRIGMAIVDALSQRLLALGKISEPLSYEELLGEEDEEEVSSRRSIA